MIKDLGDHPYNMYCDFDIDYCHTTNDCMHLAQEIGWVIQQDSGMKLILIQSEENHKPPNRAREESVQGSGRRRTSEPRKIGPSGVGPNNHGAAPRDRPLP